MCLMRSKRVVPAVKIKRLYKSAAAVITACAAALFGTGVLSAAASDETKNTQYTVSSAAAEAVKNDYYTFEPIDTTIPSFGEYYDKFHAMNRPAQTVSAAAGDAESFSGDIKSGTYTADGISKNNVLVWGDGSGTAVFDINVPETGIYDLTFSYCPIDEGTLSPEISLKIDDKTPYDTASRITLGRVWVNGHEIYKDKRGNQVRPPQVQKEMWLKKTVGDIDGLFNEPLFFFLEKGSHKITLSAEKAHIALEAFSFENTGEIPSYSEYRASVCASVTEDDTPSRLIRIEGEAASFKSDPTLYPTYDNSDYLVSPSDPRKVCYNTLGAGNWKKALQTVTWTVPKESVGNDGWYKIGIKARQNTVRGFCSNRRILIDGKVVCKELDQVSFPYGSDWSVVSPEADGDCIYVYLDASVDHTFTMEVVPGETGAAMRRLDDAVKELNDYYRKILMITGPSPDKYTDYYVHEKIPDIVDGFSRLSAELSDIRSDIESLSGSKGSEAAVLDTMTVILDKCTEKPLRIPSYLAQIKDSITSISSWMREHRDQPLEVDYIELASPDKGFSSCKRKLHKSVAFGIKAFIGSFFEDYSTLSDVTGEECIDVWVALGRDQAQVIKELTENGFMQKYDIPVSINLVTGGIVEAALAGKGPDVALFLGGEFPVNLAARGMLTDMTQFADFEEVKRRFGKNALTHYSYSGGCYGLPISRDFPMMFYRTDILSELGFTNPPETWNDLIDMLPALQRNYMSAGLILPDNNISPATESGHTFAMLLLQMGMNYYNDELTASTFDSTGAVQAFEQWTDLYTEYGFEQSYDAFSRFRTGEYPIVISNYTFFNQLTAASPEINGLWDFCQVPGTRREDGSVSHAANSEGSGAVIFNKVKNKENAWEFVKWFTETETQVQYASQIEGILGTLGRFETANTEALGQLSWSNDELARLRDQEEELSEIPIIPSSYAVTRNIMNAFRETVNKNENPRDTLIWYNRDINEEIARKRKEF